MKRLLLLALLLTMGAFFNACNKTDTKNEAEQILARVGDKTITAAEFLRRAEYTIRPAWCRGDNYIHKKIVLNSLIAEKLFALDAGDSNRLSNNEEYRRYIQGRKEQAMRQQYYYEHAVRGIKIDPQELDKQIKTAGRKYRVSYFNLPGSYGQGQIARQLQSIKSSAFDTLFARYVGADSLPQMEVDYNNPVETAVHNALFSEMVKSGQVIGPLRTADGNLFLMRVEGWTDSKIMSDRQLVERRQIVREHMEQSQAMARYERQIKKLMSGKKMQLNAPVFKAFTEAIGPDYFKTHQDKRQAFKKRFWEKDRKQMVIDDRNSALEEIAEQTLFTVDGKAWTVSAFEKHLQVHPLVFRQKKFPKNKFGKQLKLAIADVVRDMYITRDAYDEGLDNNPDVVHNTEMWRDNLLALYRRQAAARSHGGTFKTEMDLVRTALEPLADSLRAAYTHKIEINTALFETIKLTSIDMIAIQQNAPFPIVVPGFPQLTMHDKLDYGQNLNR